jgi:hypothetical protein
VVAARRCVEAIAAEPGRGLLAAESAADYVRAVDALLREPARAAAIGAAGRRRVMQSCSWEAQLSGFDRHLACIAAESAGQAA